MLRLGETSFIGSWILYLYAFFGQGTDVRHVVATTGQKSMQGTRISEFLRVGLVESLTEFTPHGVQHEFSDCPSTFIHCNTVYVENKWTQLKAESPEIRDKVWNYNIKAPLNPRDSFFGGRANAVRLCVDPRDGQQLCYYNFTSLYPWVNKYGRYPTKHPTFIYRPANPRDLSPYFGIAKCTVLPPSDLFHPVLPYHCGNKLVLCRTCAEENIDKPLLEKTWICDHTPSQRQLTGTWCTPELEKAIEKGYTLQCIHEV